jgi:hypothetical protein
MPTRRAVLGTLPALTLAPAALAQRSRDIPLGPNADLRGLRLLPPDSPWHRDISRAPVDPRTTRILARIGLDTPLHADFGPEWNGAPVGIPFMVVPGDQRRVPISFKYADESDPGPYPILPDVPIEGGPHADGDRHIIVFDVDNWRLYEVYDAHPVAGGGWRAGSGAIWDLLRNQERPAGWTSADASGMPILPGLVRHDEVESGVIRHALRFTLRHTRRAYVPPASHRASTATDEDLPPMGMRVRLRADFDLSGLSREARIVLTALKTYGMFLADNGSDLFVSGVPDQRWNVDALRGIMRVTSRDLEVIAMEGLVTPRR